MKLLIILCVLISSHAFAWEDHPDKEDHKRTDYLFRTAEAAYQKIKKADELTKEIRENCEKQREEICGSSSEKKISHVGNR